jgi:hypothetical protein
VWSIRQDPKLYTIASRILSSNQLWVDINRSIQKLPGQGDEELLHWDFNPFNPAPDTARETPSGVCGKACYTRSRFVAVPGTHTPEFHRRFVEAYRPHYPIKPSACKFGLQGDRPDPLQLLAARHVYEVPAGCVVLWSPLLLHGQVKTPLGDPTEYGCYVGYFPAGPRREYAVRCGVGELEDRLESYRAGRAPRLWPSLDPVHYYPKRFMNFPKILQAVATRADHARTHPRTHPRAHADILPPWIASAQAHVRAHAHAPEHHFYFSASYSHAMTQRPRTTSTVCRLATRPSPPAAPRPAGRCRTWSPCRTRPTAPRRSPPSAAAS